MVPWPPGKVTPVARRLLAPCPPGKVTPAAGRLHGGDGVWQVIGFDAKGLKTLEIRYALI